MRKPGLDEMSAMSRYCWLAIRDGTREDRQRYLEDFIGGIIVGCMIAALLFSMWFMP